MKTIRRVVDDATRWLRAATKKNYHIGPSGNLVRNEPKRPEGISARQWKRQERTRRRWEKNNTAWFGAEEAAKVGDRRI